MYFLFLELSKTFVGMCGVSNGKQGTRQRDTQGRMSLNISQRCVRAPWGHGLKDRCLQCLGLQATDKGKTGLECLRHAQGLRFNMSSCGCRGRKEIQPMCLRMWGFAHQKGPDWSASQCLHSGSNLPSQTRTCPLPI